jgi:hypothetical protein
MPNSLESSSKTDPFAVAIALQEAHARAYSELAERIRSDSPEAASFLLILRQRQQSELRKLMCVYGFSSSKEASHPSSGVGGKEPGNSKGITERSKLEIELKRKIFVFQIVQPGLAGLMDGSVSIGAGFCGSVCHPQFSDSFSRRDGGFAWGRN